MDCRKYLLVFSILFFMMVSCSNSSGRQTAAVGTNEVVEEPRVVFNADSAYSYVAAQCAFGERVPNTEAHRLCGDYLASELRRHGADVTEQRMTLTAFDGTKIEARNIIGEYFPEKQRRIGTAVPGQTMIPTRQNASCRLWEPTMERVEWECFWK